MTYYVRDEALSGGRFALLQPVELPQVFALQLFIMIHSPIISGRKTR